MKTVDYLDGFQIEERDSRMPIKIKNNNEQYTGGELNFFPHAEGYVNVTLGTTGNRIFNYVYNYTDHLGNIRLSYTKDMVDNKLKILEENHYYPFGLKHQKYTASATGLKAIDENTARPGSLTSTPYNYKYNGQEWQDELGLNMYDMDMRQYDPAIARWVVLDPVIHHSMSPYNAFDNNPVFWADPSGADGEAMSAFPDRNLDTFGTTDTMEIAEIRDDTQRASAFGQAAKNASSMKGDGKDDWIRNNTTGEIIDNPNVTSSSNTPKGFDYIGPNSNDIVKFLFGNNKFSKTTKDFGILGMEEDNGSSAAFHFSANTKLSVLISAVISNGKFQGVYLDASVYGTHSRAHDSGIGLGGSFNIQGYDASQSALPRGASSLISTQGSVNGFGSAFYSSQNIQASFGKSVYLNVSYKGIYGFYSGQHSWGVFTHATALGGNVPNYTNVGLKIPMNQRITTSIKH